MPRERANERACDKAIEKTLAYRATFKYPLSYYQLTNSLISTKKFKKEFFDGQLNKMVKKGYIGFRDGKYFDKRIKPVSWETRKKNAKNLFKKALKIAETLKYIPWIKCLCVTGSIAAYNADKAADIDVFIITKTHRLWLTRGFASLILRILNVYALGGYGPGKICPNLFIDDQQLEWPKEQRSIFTAHEILLMQPIIDRDNTYLKFIHANKWVKDYFGNFENNFEFIKNKDYNGNRFVNLLEKIAMLLQLFYMKKKRTNEIVTKHMIHFKKNDNTAWILEGYEKLGG